VPDPQREELARFIATCAQVAPNFRWTPGENLHLTLRFIGSVERVLAETIADALADQPLASVQLQLGGIGTFGRPRAARVVWLGLNAGAEAAGALAAQVDAECVRAGLSREERAFQAHMTLARARSRDGSRLPELAATPRLDPWLAAELVLYSSRLTKTGAVYETLRTLPLR
jgi:2'-5' RNA ligase